MNRGKRTYRRLPNPKTYRPLYPFSSRFMQIQGHFYHYVDEGDGEPVVMVHGNPTWSFYYRRLVTALSNRYRTIVPDHIGCGLSDKPSARDYDYTLQRRVDDFEAFMDRLGVTGNITLIVHDWGGMIAMAWAVRHPDRVARVVILNTAAFLPPSGKSLPFRLWILRHLKPLATPAVLGLNLFAVAALHMAVRKPLAPQVRSGLVAPYNSWKNRIATLRFVYDIPLKETDPGFRLVKSVDETLTVLSDRPFLICWGAHDFVFDGDYYREWRRRFPHAQAHLLEDAGHYVIEDAPETVTRLVTSFLSSSGLENASE